MDITFLKNRFATFDDDAFMVWNGDAYSYRWLRELIEHLEKQWGELAGKTVALNADYEPLSVAALLALGSMNAIVLPVLNSVAVNKQEEYFRLFQAQYIVTITSASIELSERDMTRTELSDPVAQLRAKNRAGLVLFSSGSTGSPKGVVHEFERLLTKHQKTRRPLRTIPFLLFDHIGGVNTMLHTLSSGGTLVIVNDRLPETVCRAIEQWKVEFLPTSPTFLNMLLLSGLYSEFDLSSLLTVSYGAELMPSQTLARMNAIFPDIKIVQAYGMSEIGIVSTQSRSTDSLWMKLGGDGVETRVREGILEIKTQSTMLGYINAPSPFAEDGWLITGDLVEVDGDYIRILGRQSDVINIGGEKVFPREIENVLLSMPVVQDASVYSKSHPLIGQMIIANIALNEPIDRKTFSKDMRLFCSDRLEAFKVPQKVNLINHALLYTDRLKKVRREVVDR